MRKYLKSMRFKLDNRGAGIPLILVTVGLATLLVSVLLMVSLFDFQMKTTEEASKDNFYSAEAVLDQIQTGLRHEASAAASGAYTTAVEAYGLTGGADSDVAENTRVLNFRATYTSALKTILCTGTSSTMYYVGGFYDGDNPGSDEYDDTTHTFTKGLAKYVDSEVAGLIANGDVQISYNHRSGNEGNLVIDDNGITLKSITIEYLGDGGYYDRITTDITIGFPDISLKEASVAPNAVYYTLIADNGVLVKTGADATFGGEVFAGQHAANANDTAEAGSQFMKAGSGLELKTGSKLSANMGSSSTNPDRLIVEGNTEVDDSSKLYLYGGQFWTDNINIYNTSTFETDYENLSFVSDDLTSNGNNALIKLRGSYYGYAGGTFSKVSKNVHDPAYSLSESSSAIVINGSNTTADLWLDTLNLYGSSYLTKDSFAYELGNTTNDSYVEAADTAQNVLLGSSLSVKTDQIAFLAPAECLPLKADATSTVTRNPMTVDEYQTWSGSANTTVKGSVNTAAPLTQLEGLSIAEVIGTSEAVDTTVIWRKVGSNKTTVAYVYLSFSDELAASRYLAQYAAASRSNLQKYATKYNNTISVYTGNEINTAGALLYNVNSTSFNVNPGKDMSEFYGMQDLYWSRFQALRSMLVTNISGLTDTQLNQSVFHNVIKVSAIEDVSNPAYEVFTVDGLIGIVTRNDVTIQDGKVSYGGTETAELSKVRFILNTGNVYIKDSAYTGSIITDGTLYVDGASSINCTEANSGEVEVILRYEADSDTESLIEKYFINGKNYLFGSSASTSGEDSIYVDFNELVTYSNWTKE